MCRTAAQAQKKTHSGGGFSRVVGAATARWTSQAWKALGDAPRPCGGVATIRHIHDTTSSGRCGRGRGSSSPARRRVTKVDRQGFAAGDRSRVTASASRLAERRPSVGEVAVSRLVYAIAPTAMSYALAIPGEASAPPPAAAGAPAPGRRRSRGRAGPDDPDRGEAIIRRWRQRTTPASPKHSPAAGRRSPGARNRSSGAALADARLGAKAIVS